MPVLITRSVLTAWPVRQKAVHDDEDFRIEMEELPPTSRPLKYRDSGSAAEWISDQSIGPFRRRCRLATSCAQHEIKERS